MKGEGPMKSRVTTKSRTARKARAAATRAAAKELEAMSLPESVRQRRDGDSRDEGGRRGMESLKSTKEIVKFCEERGVGMIHLWFVDILGQLKSVGITLRVLQDALEEGVG